MTFQQRYQATLAEIVQACEASHRDPSEVTLLAVSKTVDIDCIKEAFSAGATQFGENRPDSLVEKAQALPQATWHFIGNIQSRRINDIVAHAALIHSVCKQEHLAKINEAAQRHQKVQRILLEVNVSGEESKSGLTPHQALLALDEALSFDHIAVCGLMTMAPRGNAECARNCFRELCLLSDRMRASLTSTQAAVFNELSMGMSEDWREAVSEGGTIVRIGRALFDERFSQGKQ